MTLDLDEPGLDCLSKTEIEALAAELAWVTLLHKNSNGLHMNLLLVLNFRAS